MKQIQNEQSYRSSVWQAESGLECMFAYIKTTHNPWGSPSFCQPITGNPLSLEELGDGHFRLHSISGYVSLSRELVLVSVQGEEIKVSWRAGSWYEH
ncbi:hypothetical protein M9194_21095 [Vibrio sp. S4M6]|uniref:hypothetical protein n=1 Tax=Vibrio sinus TaxID=2946865 RepID=UPI002029B94B|nr:hypothetical protein [Vibrio sinus]MCL9783920.1 hypothetical protein [Vibrio sinus]